MFQVVDGAGGRSEVKNVIDLAEVKRPAHILFPKLETRLVTQVGDVLQAAGKKIVGADHGVILCQQRIAKMRAEKPGPARYQHTH